MHSDVRQRNLEWTVIGHTLGSVSDIPTPKEQLVVCSGHQLKAHSRSMLAQSKCFRASSSHRRNTLSLYASLVLVQRIGSQAQCQSDAVSDATTLRIEDLPAADLPLRT